MSGIADIKLREELTLGWPEPKTTKHWIGIGTVLQEIRQNLTQNIGLALALHKINQNKTLE